MRVTSIRVQLSGISLSSGTYVQLDQDDKHSMIFGTVEQVWHVKLADLDDWNGLSESW